MLSRDQFKTFTSNTREGGDTVNAASGERPTSGFMVSQHGSERQIPADALKTSDTVRFTRDHIQKLSSPDAHLGGWTSEGTTYLDVSRRFESMGAAQAAGHRNKQLAIYDLNAGDELPVQQRASSVDRMRARHDKRAKLA